MIGGTEAVLAKYRFTAQNEELNLKRLTFGLDLNTETVISLSLFDGTTRIAGPITYSGLTTFDNLSFVVPKDGSKTLTVKAQMNSVGPSGSASGLEVALSLCDGYGASCPGSGEFEARGTSLGSSTLLTEFNTASNDDSLFARSKFIRKTRPTVSLASLPTSTLSNGTQVLSRFTVTADAAQQVSLKTVSFELNLNDVSGTALAVTAPAVREVGQGSDLSASTTAAILNCTGSATCSFPITFDSEQTISAGASKTYELRATVAGADASGESISTKLLGDTAQVTGEIDSAAASSASNGIDDLDGSAADGAYNFIWSDNSLIPHSDTTATNASTDDTSASNDWTNGRHVKGLSSDAQTMTRS